MFGAPKPAFGQTGTTFGGFGSTGTTSTSPFTTTFGNPAGSGAFGAAPAFGSTTTGSTPGLFGSTTAPGTGLFGALSTSAGNTPAFGATSGQQGFSFGQSNTGTLFGSNTHAGSTLLGQIFIIFKPGGFGFGGTSTANTGTGLFGAAPQQSTGLFGQQSATPQTTGMFGSSGGFGNQQQPTGTVVKYAPLGGTDVMVKGGQSQTINISYNCITFMKEYENKSLEELRLEDYAANRKGPQAGATPGLFGTPGATSAFGAPATSAFGQAKAGGMFGQTTVTCRNTKRLNKSGSPPSCNTKCSKSVFHYKAKQTSKFWNLSSSGNEDDEFNKERMNSSDKQITHNVPDLEASVGDEVPVKAVHLAIDGATLEMSSLRDNIKTATVEQQLCLNVQENYNSLNILTLQSEQEPITNIKSNGVLRSSLNKSERVVKRNTRADDAENCLIPIIPVDFKHTSNVNNNCNSVIEMNTKPRSGSRYGRLHEGNTFFNEDDGCCSVVSFKKMRTGRRKTRFVHFF